MGSHVSILKELLSSETTSSIDPITQNFSHHQNRYATTRLRTFECPVVGCGAVRAHVVRRCAGDGFAGVGADAPAVPRRLVALLGAVLAVRKTLRDEDPALRVHPVHLLRVATLFSTVQLCRHCN